MNRRLLPVLLAAASLGMAANAMTAQAASNWDIHASVSEIYDDNIAYAESDETSDLITQLSLGLGIDYETPRQRLRFMGKLNPQIFARHSEFNNLSQDLDANWRMDFSKYTRFSVKDVFTHAEDPRSFQDTLGRASGRYSYMRNRLNAQVRHEFSKQFALIGRYGNEITDLSRDTLRDSVFHTVGAQGEYAVSSETFFLGSYDFGIRDFQPGNDALSHTGQLGVRQYLTPAVFLEGRAGLDALDDFTGDTSVKPRLHASINHEVDEESLASVTIDQSYETTTYAEDLLKSWRASLAYRRQLLKRLNGSVAGFFGQSEYENTSIEDDIAGAAFSLVYELSPDWTAGVSYQFSNIESTDQTKEYLKNTVMLTMSLKL